MFFLATSNAQGDCDVSFRAGEVGFVHALGGKILVYPEYRGNGVMASLANITENPHAGLLFVDFIQDKVGLHVNGAARILSNEEVLACPDLTDALRADIAAVGGRRPERWVLVTVEEAYIHCSKHIPRLEKVGEEVRQWGTDDDRAKGGDYFRAKSAAKESLGAAASLTRPPSTPKHRASPGERALAAIGWHREASRVLRRSVDVRASFVTCPGRS